MPPGAAEDFGISGSRVFYSFAVFCGSAGCSFLAELDCPEALSRLLRCLREDPSGPVRYSAVDALERCGDLSVIPALRQAAENDSGTDYEGRPIRDKALKAIERITERNR